MDMKDRNVQGIQDGPYVAMQHFEMVDEARKVVREALEPVGKALPALKSEMVDTRGQVANYQTLLKSQAKVTNDFKEGLTKIRDIERRLAVLDAGAREATARLEAHQAQSESGQLSIENTFGQVRLEIKHVETLVAEKGQFLTD